MSYKDGKNVPGSNSPYTVWLICEGSAGVVGIDYRTLNDYIRLYNSRHYKYVDFWNWLSWEAFNDDYSVTGFSVLWNDKNPNMSQVIGIR